jgi:hypothetical protein
MKENDKGWLVLAVAAGMAGGLTLEFLAQRRRQRVAAHLEHKADIKSWENEGGNVKPAS